MRRNWLNRRAFAQGLAATALANPLIRSRLATATEQSLVAPTDKGLIAAAKADGALTTYGTSSILAIKSDAEGFQKGYGIPVTYTQITSAPLTARVEQEIKAGAIAVDVIMSADRAAMDRWAAAGQFAKLPAIDYPGRTEYLA